jgi:hypothetical protein
MLRHARSWSTMPLQAPYQDQPSLNVFRTQELCQMRPRTISLSSPIVGRFKVLLVLRTAEEVSHQHRQQTGEVSLLHSLMLQPLAHSMLPLQLLGPCSVLRLTISNHPLLCSLLSLVAPFQMRSPTSWVSPIPRVLFQLWFL